MKCLRAEVLGVFASEPKPFEPNPKIQSAFYKSPVSGAVRVEPGKLHGDASGNQIHHGGQDRVIHHYPQEHYQEWKQRYPEHEDEFIPGSIGENISTKGILESDVCVGDIFQLGSAKIQLTEGRKPCGFIDQRFAVPKMHKQVQKLIKMGWFYRVLESGEFQVGSDLELMDRPTQWARLDIVSDVLMNKKTDDRELLKRISKLPTLSQRWQDKALKLLKS